MVDLPAVNASPLIFLSRAGLLDLLQLAAPEVVVPMQVAEEIGRRGPQDLTAQAIESTSWLRAVEIAAIPQAILAWDLGAGESAVLTWCFGNERREAIIDDLAARRCANALGIRVRGTLGLVLLAKKQGRIQSAQTVVGRLRQSGMYLSNGVVARALALVGE